MPLKELGGALATAGISAAANVGGGLISQLLNLRANRQQQLRDIVMWSAQNRLNRTNWEMENQYNSPAMQMQRLKEAGLNPNLVYGNGATATGGNIQQSQPQKSEPYEMRNPLEGFSLQSIYDMQLRKAQTNLTMESAKTQISIQKLNALKSLLTETQNQREKQTTEFEKKTFDDRAQLISEQINKTLAEMDAIRSGIDVNQATIEEKRANTKYTVDKNIREGIQQNWSIKETTARIAKTYADIELTNSQTLLTDRNAVKAYYDSIVAKYESIAASKGYKLSDPAYSRMMKEMVEELNKGQYKRFGEDAYNRFKKGIAPSYRK